MSVCVCVCVCVCVRTHVFCMFPRFCWQYPTSVCVRACVRVRACMHVCMHACESACICVDRMSLKCALHWHIHMSVHSVQSQCIIPAHPCVHSRTIWELQTNGDKSGYCQIFPGWLGTGLGECKLTSERISHSQAASIRRCLSVTVCNMPSTLCSTTVSTQMVSGGKDRRRRRGGGEEGIKLLMVQLTQGVHGVSN